MIDIKYSQNLYNNQKKLSRIIQSLGFQKNDILIDIGAGLGIITKELAKYSYNVIAYELDNNYITKLKHTFINAPNVIIKNENFLLTQLPNTEYKVFANIPFFQTSEIINKLTIEDSKLLEAYIFVQKEAADRFIGVPINTQIACISSANWEFKIIERFDSYDFYPKPSVDIVLLRIKRKMSNINNELYRDFITYIFNQMNMNVLDTFKKLFTYKQIQFIEKQLLLNRYDFPSDIPSTYYLELFKYFTTNGDDYTNRVKGYYLRHKDVHKNREKVNRTRRKYS